MWCHKCGEKLVTIHISGEAGFNYLVHDVDGDGSVDVVTHAEKPHSCNGQLDVRVNVR